MAGQYGVLLRNDSFSVDIVERKENETVLRFCYRVIKCDTIDIVHAEGLRRPYCLVVDDEGLLVDEPVINLYASHMYGAHKHGQAIAGRAVIMKDEIADADGSIDTVWLTLSEALRLKEEIQSNMLTVVFDIKKAVQEGVI